MDRIHTLNIYLGDNRKFLLIALNVVFTIFLRFIIDVSLSSFLITLISLVISALFGLRFYRNNMPKITIEKPDRSKIKNNRKNN